MSDGKNRFRAHVRAAREWLGRAESSLDRQEDIRSDLNLMLAQAELQRAKETKRLTKKERLLHRLAPFMAAGAMAAGCFFFLQYERSPAAAPVVPSAAAVTAQRPEAPVTAAAPEQPKTADVQNAPVLQAAAVPEPETVPAASAPIAEPVSPPAAAPAAERAPVSAEQPSPAGVPSENMQKLMRTAGQSLRAH